MADDYLLNPDLTPSSDSDDSRRVPGDDDFLSSDSDDVRRAPGNDVRLDPGLTPADITIPTVQYIPPDTAPCPGCGCMDNGNMPNTYQNNWGFTGSVTPGQSAFNYDPNATVDDGTCQYIEYGAVCGCNDPSSIDFIGQLYQNGYGGPGSLSTGSTWSPDWNLHPGHFTDCAGNIRNSVPYLAIGPYGDTSCCEQSDDRLYNYRDIFQVSGAGGPTHGIFRGVGVDGGAHSGGVDPSGNSDGRYDGHIGFDWFVIAPNLKDVHGNLFDLADFHTSDSGWTIQIYDKDKIYLGTWHYAECDSWTITPSTTTGGYLVPGATPGHYLDQALPHFLPAPAGQIGVGAWDYGLQNNIRLVLRGVTHIDGPNPLVNYGGAFWPWQQGYAQGIYSPMNQSGYIHYAYKFPKYNDQNFFILSSAHAYIKITVDANRSIQSCGSNPNPPTASATSGSGGPVTNPQRQWFESMDSGPNTIVDKMNVICLPCFEYKHSHTTFMQKQWAIGNIGTRCCVESSIPQSTSAGTPGGPVQPGATGLPCGPWHDNPHYNFPVGSHWLHPWPASHKQMITNAIWYKDLATGYPLCRTGLPCDQ